MRGLLTAIEDSVKQSPLQANTDTAVPIHQLLRKCRSYLSTLQDLAKAVLPQPGDSMSRATWKSLKAVLKADKMKTYRGNLESAKITLILAQSYSNQSVSRLVTSSPFGIALTQSRNRIEARLSTIERRVAHLSLGQEDAATGIAKLEEKLCDEARKIAAVVIESSPRSALPRSLELTIQKTVITAVEDAIRQYRAIAAPNDDINPLKSDMRREGTHRTTEDRFEVRERGACSRQDAVLVSNAQTRKLYNSSKSYNTPFGNIGIQCWKIDDRPDVSRGQLNTCYRVRLVFIPYFKK